MIPMLDLKLQHAMLREEIDAAISGVLASTQFIQGENVREFEAEAAEYLGVRHALSCNSGSDALHLALRACNIGPGDEVITTPFSFAAAAEAIGHVGATAVFVDIDPHTFNITAASIEPAITDRTRAILPVHLFGQAADMEAICELAGRHELRVIEDCAQSFGARSNGTPTGGMGDAGCFSFFPSKNLGGYGDGGLFTTNSDLLAEHFSLLKNHGSPIRNRHQVLGWNSRLDELQAAVLRVKLRHLDAFNRKRIDAATRYTRGLEALPVQTPQPPGDLSHVFHQYTLLSPKRDAIIERLQQAQIGHAVYYPQPLPSQQAFSGISRSLELRHTEATCRQCLSLPMFPEISKTQIETVVGMIQQAHGG